MGPSVVSPNWLVFRRKGFSPPARRERRADPPWVCEERATTREAKSSAARRVAPKMALGFVAPRSQSLGAMLPRPASPKAILGATKHQPIGRHHTSNLTPEGQLKAQAVVVFAHAHKKRNAEVSIAIFVEADLLRSLAGLIATWRDKSARRKAQIEDRCRIAGRPQMYSFSRAPNVANQLNFQSPLPAPLVR